MHRFPKKTDNLGAVPCFYHHHNTAFFGLSKRDAPVTGTRIKDWNFPSQSRIASHRKDVMHLLQPRAIALLPTTPRMPPAAPRVAPATPPVIAAALTATRTVQQSRLEPPIDMNKVI